MRNSLLVVVASLLFSAPAAAQDSDRPPDTPRLAPADSLRAAGRVVLDDVAATGIGGPLSLTLGWVSIASSTHEAQGVRETSTALAFMPSADVFVFEGLSVGGMLGVSRTTSKVGTTGTPPDGVAVTAGTSERSTTARFISPRVGYAFRLSDDVLFWPRIHVGYGTSETTASNGAGVAGIGLAGVGVGGLGAGAPGSSSSGEMWNVGGDASIVLALGRHAALAAGPTISYAFEKQDDPHDAASSFDITVRGSLRLAF